jgi:hypothetical protein
MGPVQVLVISLDAPTFSGEVLEELTKLREAGIVRLIDMLVVSRAMDGTIETVELPPGLEPGLGNLADPVVAAIGEAVRHARLHARTTQFAIHPQRRIITASHPTRRRRSSSRT